jgi:hypothetical protein
VEAWDCTNFHRPSSRTGTQAIRASRSPPPARMNRPCPSAQATFPPDVNVDVVSYHPDVIRAADGGHRIHDLPARLQLPGVSPDVGATGTLRQHGGGENSGQGRIMPLSPEMAAVGGTTRWQPYFEVADCDVAAAAVTANGGTVVVPASDIPGVGRFAVALDPDGHSSP